MKLTIGYSFLELLELTMRIDYRLIGEIVALAKSFRRIGNLRYPYLIKQKAFFPPFSVCVSVCLSVSAR